jgi:hypothetical protein
MENTKFVNHLFTGFTFGNPEKKKNQNKCKEKGRKKG